VRPTKTSHISQADAAYPPALRVHLRDEAPGRIAAIGDIAILRVKTLALFCSVKCPGNLILQTYDAACALRDAGVTVIGGFHSPMEKECLTLLLRGTQPVVICPARGIEGMRVPGEWREPLAQGRLLILSPFDNRHRRPTEELSQRRNDFVAALADEVLVAYAAPGGKTDQFCRRILRWGKPLLTLADDATALLIALGAKPMKPETHLRE